MTYASYTTPSARWRAIVNRDPSATNFVYGVRTTKIYCRPRCPARLARRANVIFYDTADQAEKAGYRPCKRCKPQEHGVPLDPHIKLAQKACETMTLAVLAGAYASGSGKARPTLQDLASEAGLTPSHFHRVFKKVVGVTPGKFARNLREGKNMVAMKRSVSGSESASDDSPVSPGTVMNVFSPVTGAGQDAAVLGSGQIQTTCGLVSDTAQVPDAFQVDWNEFDRLLAEQAGATTQTQLGGGSLNADGGGFYIPGDESFNHTPEFAGSPELSDPSEPFGFTEHGNDIVDFSRNAVSSDLGGKLFENVPYASPAYAVPSIDTPPYIDMFADMVPPDSLFEDFGLLENGNFQSYM